MYQKITKTKDMITKSQNKEDKYENTEQQQYFILPFFLNNPSIIYA